MNLYADEIRTLHGRLVDLVTRTKITILVAKAPPMPDPEPKFPHIIDYIGLVGKR